MPGRTWREIVRSAFATVLDAALPASCATCRRTGEPICDWCLSTIRPVSGLTCAYCEAPIGGGTAPTWHSTRCERCQRIDPDMPRFQPATAFETTIRDAIHALKYRDRPDVARPLATLLEEPARAIVGSARPIVVPVALHPRRLDERGYDQSGLLAFHLARACAWPLVQAVQRTRETSSQVGLSRAARRANVAGAFQATMRLDGAHVLLVDDVVTTGATLTAAAQVCRAAGATSVVATCLARNRLTP